LDGILLESGDIPILQFAEDSDIVALNGIHHEVTSNARNILWFLYEQQGQVFSSDDIRSKSSRTVSSKQISDELKSLPTPLRSVVTSFTTGKRGYTIRI